MKALLLIAAMPLLAQQRISSPAIVGGVNCGEIQLRKQFPNSGQYMAWRNCENVGEMSMELINNANELKARFSNSGSGTLTLFNSSSATGLFMSGLGSLQGYNGGIERVRLNSSNPILDLKNTSNVNIVRLDGSGAGGALTSAGTSLTLSQTGDSIGSSTLELLNRFGINGARITVGAVNLADIQQVGSGGAQLSIRAEFRAGTTCFGASCTYLDSSIKEYQLGDLATGNVADIGLMINVNGAGVGRGDYFRLLGSSSGYIGLRGPATGPNIDWTLPSGAGASGQCWGYSSAGVLGWVTCSGGSGFVDLTSAQDISGIKYASTVFRAAELEVRATSSGGNLWQTYIASAVPVTEWFPSTSGTPSLTVTGNRSSTGTAAIQFFDQSGNNTLAINGGSSTSFPSLSLSTATGPMVDIRYGGSLAGGVFSVYTNSGNQAVVIDGTGNGRIRASNGSVLRTGFTGTVNFTACTAGEMVMGLYIGGC